MLLFLPVFLLALAAIGLNVVNRYRPVPRTFWYTALAGPVLSGLVLLFLRFRLPQSHAMLFASLGELSFQATWLLNSLNWPLAFALVILMVSICLVRVDRVASATWQYWARFMVLGAAGLFALLAGDLFSLLISLTALDIIILIFEFQTRDKGNEFKQSVYHWGMRLAASFGIIWSLIAFGARGNLSLEAVPERAALLLLFSAGLRLGFLPLNRLLLRRPPEPLTMNILIPVVSGLPAISLLAHTALALPALNAVWLLIPLASGLFAASKAFPAGNEFEAFPFWLMALVSVGLALALVGEPAAVIASGLVLILIGPLLWLARARERFLLPLSIVGAVALAGVPGTPAYQLALAAGAADQLLLYLILPIWGLLAAAWVRHSRLALLDEEPYREGAFGIYLLGLSLLPLTYGLFGVGLAPAIEINFDLPTYLPWLLAIAVGAAAFLLRTRQIYLSPVLRSRVKNFFSLGWLYTSITYLVTTLTSFLRLISALLEGEAGVLWALLFVALLLSMMSQFATAV